MNEIDFWFAIGFHLKVGENECSSMEHHSVIFLQPDFISFCLLI